MCGGARCCECAHIIADIQSTGHGAPSPQWQRRGCGHCGHGYGHSTFKMTKVIYSFGHKTLYTIGVWSSVNFRGIHLCRKIINAYEDLTKCLNFRRYLTQKYFPQFWINVRINYVICAEKYFLRFFGREGVNAPMLQCKKPATVFTRWRCNMRIDGPIASRSS